MAELTNRMDQWTNERTDEWTDGPNEWTTLRSGDYMAGLAAVHCKRRGWEVAAAA